MNEEQARQYYITIKTLKKNISELTQTINDLDSQTGQIQETQQALENIAELQEGDDILAPIADGIFISAKAVKQEKLHINVGAGTVVEKTPAEVSDMLTKQNDELSRYREQLIDQREELLAQVDDIQDKVAEDVDV